jgi:DNA-binding response OmpR family regulator
MESIDLMRRWKPDLVIVDWMMPKVNGYQLIKIIRESRGDERLLNLLAGGN